MLIKILLLSLLYITIDIDHDDIMFYAIQLVLTCIILYCIMITMFYFYDSIFQT